jgi:hypothetical protein
MVSRRIRVAVLLTIGLFAWPTTLKTQEAEPTDPQLRVELLKMERVDQEARKRWACSQSKVEELLKIAEEIDKPHTRRLKEIVEKYGWPGKSLVGRDGSKAAWLLVQHVGRDVMEFLEQALALMKQGAATGEVALHDVAYLGDRIAMYQKKPQQYGTQYTQGPDGAMVLHPIEDEEHVDERRAAAGLPTMAEQEKQMSKFYGKPVRKSR